jgi:hypothetical protein
VRSQHRISQPATTVAPKPASPATAHGMKTKPAKSTSYASKIGSRKRTQVSLSFTSRQRIVRGARRASRRMEVVATCTARSVKLSSAGSAFSGSTRTVDTAGVTAYLGTDCSHLQEQRRRICFEGYSSNKGVLSEQGRLASPRLWTCGWAHQEQLLRKWSESDSSN